MEERHIFSIWIECQCEKTKLFKKVFNKEYLFLNRLAYCFESDIWERYKDCGEMQQEFITDWNGWHDWKIVSREMKYVVEDDAYTFKQLSNGLSAKDFLQYCKDNMITSVIISK